MRQSFRHWLELQVASLEQQIKSNNVFDAESKPTHEELMKLRRLAVIHRFLERQLREIESRGEPAILRPRNPRRAEESDLIRLRAS